MVPAKNGPLAERQWHTKPSANQLQKDIFSTFVVYVLLRCVVAISVCFGLHWHFALFSQYCGCATVVDACVCVYVYLPRSCVFMLCGRHNYDVHIHMRYKLSARTEQEQRSGEKSDSNQRKRSCVPMWTWCIHNLLPVHKSFSRENSKNNNNGKGGRWRRNGGGSGVLVVAQNTTTESSAKSRMNAKQIYALYCESK